MKKYESLITIAIICLFIFWLILVGCMIRQFWIHAHML